MLRVQLTPTPVIQRSSLYGDQTIRFVAFLIDSILLVFFYSLIFYSITNQQHALPSWSLGNLQSNFQVGMVAEVVEKLFITPYFLLAHWLYYTLLEASPRQATIGKFVLGLQVTDLHGKPLNLAKSNIRYIVKVVLAAPVLIGFLLIINERRKQVLHDYIAKTVVVSIQKYSKNTIIS
ncbi:RDD family protein [Pontibacter qinzhouensis]|uniref:RDD family protein n=1 Tax=Pontibacter qinzhouensis TaxID=2603253 RepID=A0A5C8KAV2_9BACT|nr:RDD family protein [Pontibacter qinzhouensis]TXK48646.1 RDD family protein [Pontibacter qinzhouensis]